jgi:hypothetical protein
MEDDLNKKNGRRPEQKNQKQHKKKSIENKIKNKNGRRPQTKIKN